MDRESIVQKALMEELILEFHGSYVRKIHQSMYSHSGIPDILACIRGKFIGIEVKTSKGKLTALQKHEACQISLAHGKAFICRGKEGIERVIDEIRLYISDSV